MVGQLDVKVNHHYVVEPGVWGNLLILLKLHRPSVNYLILVPLTRAVEVHACVTAEALSGVYQNT